jgi:hypothetical protein
LIAVGALADGIGDTVLARPGVPDARLGRAPVVPDDDVHASAIPDGKRV